MDFFVRQGIFSPESWVDSKGKCRSMAGKDPLSGVLTIFRHALGETHHHVGRYLPEMHPQCNTVF